MLPSEIKIGDRIRVTEKYADGTCTIEGVVAGVVEPTDGLESYVRFRGGVPTASVHVTPFRQVTIRHLSSASPRGLGSVVRAKVSGAGPYQFVRTDNPAAEWFSDAYGWARDADLSDIEVVREA